VDSKEILERRNKGGRSNPTLAEVMTPSAGPESSGELLLRGIHFFLTVHRGQEQFRVVCMPSDKALLKVAVNSVRCR